MTLYESASRATLPWRSIDAEQSVSFETLPQQEIDVCLMCPHRADACARCNGTGILAERGRPKKEIDIALLREMLKLKRCNRDMCAALNVSERTLQKAKKEILKEETI